MYVLRITRPNVDSDYKTFSTLQEAKRRFHAVDDRISGDFDGVTLFEAPGADDAWKAVEAVKAGYALQLDRDLWSSLFGPSAEH